MASSSDGKLSVPQDTQAQWEELCQEDDSTALQASLLENGVTEERCHLFYHWHHVNENALGRLLLSACRAKAVRCTGVLLKLTSRQVAIELFYYDDEMEEVTTVCHVASLLGLHELLRLYVEAGADVSVKAGRAGVTCLHIAAEYGHIRCLRILAAVADVNEENEFGGLPVHFAAGNGHAQCVRKLAELGTDVNHRNLDSSTPVHWAARDGHVECLHALVEMGASISCAGKAGELPIHLAAAKGHVECLRELAGLGADVNCSDEDKRTPVHLAAENGRVECIQALVQLGADIGRTSKFGNLPIHVAAYWGHVECVQRLAELGMDVNCWNERNRTPIHLAAQEGHLDCIKALVRLGSYVSCVDQVGEIPIHLAAVSGHVDCLRELAGLGMDVNSLNNNKITAIHLAAEKGRVECVQALAELGANINCTDKSGDTPVHLAACSGHVECVQALLSHDVDVNCSNQDMRTPLHKAAQEGHVACVQALAQRGAKLSCATKSGNLPIHIAAYNGHIECIQALAALGTDVNCPNKDARTALHRAAEAGHVKCLQTLVTLGADIGYKTESGNLPLHFAAYFGHVECVRELATLGTDVNCSNEDMRTPLHRAAQEGHVACVEALVGLGADVRCTTRSGKFPIHLAAAKGEVACVRKLVDLGSDVNCSNMSGSLPIHVAASNGHVSCVRELASLGTDVNSMNEDRRTPLLLAAQEGHVTCVEALAELGANLSCTTKSGSLPIHFAADSGHVECVRKLADLGADVNCTNEKKRTAIHWAAEKGHVGCVQALVKLGADVNCKDKSGRTPLTLCCQRLHWDCATVLLAAHADVFADRKETTIAIVTFALGKLTTPVVALQLRSAFKDYLQSATRGRMLKVDSVVMQSKVLERAEEQREDIVFILSVAERLSFKAYRPILLVRLLGPPGSGKTTLIKSILGRSGLMRAAKFLLRGDIKDSSPSARTKGIRRHYDDGVIYVDVGGQYEYMAAHQRLLAPGGLPVLDLMLVDCTTDDPRKVRSGVRQWANFAACRKDGAEKSDALLVGTRDDYAREGQRSIVREEQQLLASGMGDHIHFIDPGVAFVDARNVRSATAIRDIIRSWRDQTAKAGVRVSRNVIEAFLDDVRCLLDTTLAVGVAEFARTLFVAITGMAAEVVADHVEYIEGILDVNLKTELFRLNQECLLFYFPESDIVVTDPTWLMEEITGKLFSPRSFPPPHVSCDRDGFAKVEHVTDILGRNSKVSGEIALEIAEKLGMCLRTHDTQHVLVLPAREEQRSERHWPPPRSGEHLAYTGRRLYCRSGVAISAALIPTLQMFLIREYGSGEEPFPLWKHGIRITSSDRFPRCQCLLEAVEGQLAVNVITRGPEAADVQNFHHLIAKRVQKEAVSLSPGSELESVFIAEDLMSGSEQLRRLDTDGELADGMAFLASERVRGVFRYPDAASPTNTSLPSLQQDHRLNHPYTDGVLPYNLDSAAGQQKAARYCSAMFQHRTLFQSVKLQDCTDMLVDQHQINRHAQDDVMKLLPASGADALRNAISDLPDSVAVTFVETVLPSVPGSAVLYRTLTSCPGHIKCQLHPCQPHHPVQVRDRDAGEDGRDQHRASVFILQVRPSTAPDVDSGSPDKLVRSQSSADEDTTSLSACQHVSLSDLIQGKVLVDLYTVPCLWTFVNSGLAQCFSKQQAKLLQCGVVAEVDGKKFERNGVDAINKHARLRHFGKENEILATVDYFLRRHSHENEMTTAALLSVVHNIDAQLVVNTLDYFLGERMMRCLPNEVYISSIPDERWIDLNTLGIYSLIGSRFQRCFSDRQSKHFQHCVIADVHGDDNNAVEIIATHAVHCGVGEHNDVPAAIDYFVRRHTKSACVTARHLHSLIREVDLALAREKDVLDLLLVDENAQPAELPSAAGHGPIQRSTNTPAARVKDINSHATATPAPDTPESSAVESAPSDGTPPGSTGHPCDDEISSMASGEEEDPRVSDDVAKVSSLLLASVSQHDSSASHVDDTASSSRFSMSTTSSGSNISSSNSSLAVIATANPQATAVGTSQPQHPASLCLAMHAEDMAVITNCATSVTDTNSPPS